MTVRIRPVDDADVSETTRAYFDSAEVRGAPNATFLRVLARDPNAVDVFFQAWDKIFYAGRIDHDLKEIVRVRMSRLRNCGY